VVEKDGFVSDVKKIAWYTGTHIDQVQIQISNIVGLSSDTSILQY
jgi:hypothetical protein